MVFAVVTGGGTSGHVIPAQAILEALLDAGYLPAEIKYVGSRRGIEKTLMKDASWESQYLPISGLQRSISFSSLLKNSALLWRLPHSRVLAHRWMKLWNPKVVVSVGGYASAPMTSAAKSFGVPVVCVSYDRIAGLATKRQSRYAKVCTVAFVDTDLPRPVHTGAPVRIELRQMNKDARRFGARQRLGIPVNARCLSIVGGSLGSEVLNNAVANIAQKCSTMNDVCIFHVCGPRYDKELSTPMPSNVTYIRRSYESEMADLYAATDVLLARAGASTVAEIATVGIASILVPWSGATSNHQMLNAKWLSDQNAAILLSEESLNTNPSIRQITDLLADSQKQQDLASLAYGLGALHRGNYLVAAIENAVL